MITLTVEYSGDAWRVMRDGRPLATLSRAQMAKSRARQIAETLTRGGAQVEVIACRKDGTPTSNSTVRPASDRARGVADFRMD
jgi:hypothetical protein